MIRNRLTLALMVGVLLVAALMRIHHITQQSIWFDEAFAWNIVRQPDMFPRIAADTHPPLYYLFLRGWVGGAGDSPLALRYLSALFGMVSVAITYRIGVVLVRGRAGFNGMWLVPVFAALLLAITDAEIDLAQEARNYTLYTMLACLTVWLYLELFSEPPRREGRREKGIAWILAIAALVYTHYQGVFIPAIMGVHALIFLRGRSRLVAIGGLMAAGVLFLPWFIGVTIPQAQNAIANDIPFSIPSNWDTLTQLRDGFLSGQWVIMLVLVVLGMLPGFRPHPESRQQEQTDRKGHDHKTEHDDDVGTTSMASALNRWGNVALIALWLIVPFVVLFFGNYVAALLTPRKLALITPAIALLAALGLGKVRQPAASILLVAIVGYGVLNVDFYRLKEPWDALARDAIIYAGENDLALIEVGNGQYPMRYYWEREMPPGVHVDTFPVLGDPTISVTTDWFTYYDLWLPQLLERNREARVGEVATAWLVHWFRDATTIERLEAAGYTRTMTTSRDHLGNTIYLYRYDTLPETPRTTFANGMTLQAAEIDADDLRIDLWWTADSALDTEYVTSALLLDANGVLVAQLDSVPFLGERSTLGWSAGEVVFDPKWLELTVEPLPPGDYTVQVQVYRFVDGGIENIPAETGETSETRYTVGTLTRR